MYIVYTNTQVHVHVHVHIHTHATQRHTHTPTPPHTYTCDNARRCDDPVQMELCQDVGNLIEIRVGTNRASSGYVGSNNAGGWVFLFIRARLLCEPHFF